MNPNNEIKPVEVFSGTIMEAEIIKNLLESAGIQTFLKDMNIGSIAPWYTAAGGLGSVKVVVANSDFESADLLIQDFKKNTDDEE